MLLSFRLASLAQKHCGRVFAALVLLAGTQDFYCHWLFPSIYIVEAGIYNRKPSSAQAALKSKLLRGDYLLHSCGTMLEWRYSIKVTWVWQQRPVALAV